MKRTIIAFLPCLMLISSACGPYEVEVTQEKPLEVEHKLGLEDLHAWLEQLCEANGEADPSSCADGMLADFVVFSGKQ
ncbi:MAG: hypothetical protein IT285_16115 [Bdellovibrionales bacterium]|nr:hypothetical protein [Bdellovibrionales bacterium]